MATFTSTHGFTYDITEEKHVRATIQNMLKDGFLKYKEVIYRHINSEKEADISKSFLNFRFHGYTNKILSLGDTVVDEKDFLKKKYRISELFDELIIDIMATTNDVVKDFCDGRHICDDFYFNYAVEVNDSNGNHLFTVSNYWTQAMFHRD